MAKNTVGSYNPVSIPAEFLSPSTGKYDPTLVPKDVRCAIIDCPELRWTEGKIEDGSFVKVGDTGPYEVLEVRDGKVTVIIPGYGTTEEEDVRATFPISECTRVRNPKCRQCSGPVQWRNHLGRLTGDGRACTNCPMNGLKLPVCISGCPGPNTAFASDGENMVTLGAFADPSGYIYENLPQNREQPPAPEPDCDSETDRRADGIAESESDSEPRRYSRREMTVAKKLLELDGHQFDEFREVYKAGNPKATAEKLKTTPAMFTGAMSEGNRIMRMLRFINGEEWEVIRWMMLGKSQTKVAGMTQVRKQAVNARLQHIIRENPWLERIAPR